MFVVHLLFYCISCRCRSCKIITYSIEFVHLLYLKNYYLLGRICSSTIFVKKILVVDHEIDHILDSTILSHRQYCFIIVLRVFVVHLIVFVIDHVDVDNIEVLFWSI